MRETHSIPRKMEKSPVKIMAESPVETETENFSIEQIISVLAECNVYRFKPLATRNFLKTAI